MTLQKALDLADQLKPNMMSRQVKLAFLTEIDQLIYEELVLTHETDSRNVEARFLTGISGLIEDELTLEPLQEKADVVAFIDSTRGKFHEEILRKQAIIPQSRVTFLSNIEALLQAKVEGAEDFTKAQLVEFLEDLKDAISADLESGIARPEYDNDSDDGTEMIIPSPYDMLYVYWLMAKIDHLNQEIDKYNNDRALFDNAYEQASDWWTRTHRPIQKTREFRL